MVLVPDLSFEEPTSEVIIAIERFRPFSGVKRVCSSTHIGAVPFLIKRNASKISGVHIIRHPFVGMVYPEGSI